MWHVVVVVIPFILDVRLVDAPAGVTLEEGHTGFLYLSSTVLALTFLARRIQPPLSLVDREVDFLCTHKLFIFHLLGMIFFFFFGYCEEKIPGRVTAPRLELTSQHRKVSSLPTEPPGRTGVP